MKDYKEFARKLCGGYGDMPSGCEGCPIYWEDEENGTGTTDEDGNYVCSLWKEEKGENP